MEIKIKLSKVTADHIRSPHTFFNSCGRVQEVMRKIQKEVDKKFK